jgi:hypothetical protein
MNIIKLTGPLNDANAIGTEYDRGCVRCEGKALPAFPGLLVVDDRGRYWHARCAAITLAEFTRFQEQRGADYHYERSFAVPAKRPRCSVDIKITDETLPWPQPKENLHSCYVDDGPAKTVIFTATGATIRVTPTSEFGRDTDRRRFLVECRTCQETIHEATTSATIRVRDHLWEKHDWDGAPAVVVPSPATP